MNWRLHHAVTALLLLFLGGGCATTLTSSRDLSPQSRQDVYVLDQGRTSSIVIADGSGGMIRYAYGDWEWYALGKKGILHAFNAILWPSAAGLGREHLHGPITPGSIREQVMSGWENLYVVPVDAARVAALRRDLDQLYYSRVDTEVDSPDAGLHFVRHPDAYWLPHNSNHVTAKWLTQMGVRVRGLAVLSIWKVKD